MYGLQYISYLILPGGGLVFFWGGGHNFSWSQIFVYIVMLVDGRATSIVCSLNIRTGAEVDLQH